jgi:di/tripeptidase
VADIFNMHSPLEKINFVSLQKGYELIKEIFLKFNK